MITYPRSLVSGPVWYNTSLQEYARLSVLTSGQSSDSIYTEISRYVYSAELHRALGLRYRPHAHTITCAPSGTSKMTDSTYGSSA